MSEYIAEFALDGREILEVDVEISGFYGKITDRRITVPMENGCSLSIHGRETPEGIQFNIPPLRGLVGERTEGFFEIEIDGSKVLRPDDVVFLFLGKETTLKDSDVKLHGANHVIEERGILAPAPRPIPSVVESVPPTTTRDNTPNVLISGRRIDDTSKNHGNVPMFNIDR